MRTARPGGSGIAAGLAAAVVAVATLLPASGVVVQEPGCFLCGSRAVADALMNVALYLPLGFALAWRGHRWAVVAVVGLLLSTSIELAQQLLPGRYPSLPDVVFNTVGAVTGHALWLSRRWWLAPHPRVAGVLATTAATTGVAVLAGTSALLAPGLPETTYWGQWTARFANMAAYEGRIIATRVGDVPVYSRRISRSEAVRAALLGGAETRVDYLAGPPTPSLAPLFSIYDGRHREVMLLGVDGEDLVLRYRTRGARLRFDQPELRLPGALRGVRPGEHARIRLRREGSSFCIAVDGGRTTGAHGQAGDDPPGDGRPACGLGYTVADGWGVLLFPGGIGTGPVRLLGMAWLALLFLPTGFLASRLSDAAVAALLAVAGLAMVPAWLPVLPVSKGGWVAALAGAAAGAAVRRGIQRADRMATPSTPLRTATASARTRTQRSMRR